MVDCCLNKSDGFTRADKKIFASTGGAVALQKNNSNIKNILKANQKTAQKIDKYEKYPYKIEREYVLAPSGTAEDEGPIYLDLSNYRLDRVLPVDKLSFKLHEVSENKAWKKHNDNIVRFLNIAKFCKVDYDKRKDKINTLIEDARYQNFESQCDKGHKVKIEENFKCT